MSKRIWQAIVLVFILAACNMPAGGTTTTISVESKITQAWQECVNTVGTFTHVCLYNRLINFSEATTVESGFTVVPNTIVLVNDYGKSNPFIINGNQSAAEGTDFHRVAGAYTGLVSVYYTNTTLVMSTSGKQINLNQPTSLKMLFPGWPSWPPTLPTPLVIQTTPNAAVPSATPNIIPPAFTSTDFLNIWYSQTPDTKLVDLLDEAYAKWGVYGGEYTSTTYTFIPAGTILWSVEPNNITDLSKMPFDPYNQSCFSTFNEANTVIYTVCDIYVVNPPFKYLTVSDSKDFQLGMLPAVPENIHP